MDRSITKNITYLGFSQILSKALMYVFLIMITRILGNELMGIFAYLLNLIIIFDVLIDFGLTPFMVRDIAGDRRKTRTLFLYPLLIKYSIAVPAAVILLVYSYYFEQNVEKIQSIPYVITALFTWPLFNSVVSVFQAHERQELYGMMYILRNLLLLICTYILLIFGLGVKAPVISLGISALLAAVTGYILIKRNFINSGQKEKHPHKIKYLLKNGLPFYVSAIIAALFLRIDIILLSWLRGDIETGLYKVAQQTLEGLLLIPFVVGNTIFPVLSRIANKDKEQFRQILYKSIKLLFFAAIPIVSFITFSSKEVISIFYGYDEYSGSVLPLKILVWYLIPNYINYILMFSLYAFNKQKKVLRVLFFGFLIKFLLTILYVPEFGLIASCYIGIISEFFILGGYLYLGRKIFLKSFPLVSLVKISAVSALFYYLLNVFFIDSALWYQFIFAAVIYITGVFALRVITPNELKNIKASLLNS
ncbi:flippase [candidate division KSB1 bacterium]